MDGVTTPVLEGPVESIRWEMLRDGIEDYEYLALLERLLDEKAGELSAERVDGFAQLLVVPEAISASISEFTRDPAPIDERRRQLAAAIASLSRM